MLDSLRRVNTETIDPEEIVALLAFAKGYKAEFDANAMPTPEWVDDKIRALKRELETRNADQKQRRLRELKSQRESLLSAAEKRQKLDEEIAKLETSTV